MISTTACTLLFNPSTCYLNYSPTLYMNNNSPDSAIHDGLNELRWEFDGLNELRGEFDGG